MSRSNTLEQVIAQLDEREQLGISKYATTVDRSDLSLIEWLEHAKEEAMDQVLYLQAAINKLKAEGKQMTAGGKYNWISQSERLVYLGRAGAWHQFALVENQSEVWCEVLDSELYLIEETKTEE